MLTLNQVWSIEPRLLISKIVENIHKQSTYRSKNSTTKWQYINKKNIKSSVFGLIKTINWTGKCRLGRREHQPPFLRNNSRISNATQLIRKDIAKCWPCRKLNAKPDPPFIAEERLEYDTKPFNNTDILTHIWYGY